MLQQLWQLRAFQWSLGGGLLASVCCVGPPLAVLMGLSGASFLVGLTLYSPYFYVLSFGLLIVGYIVTQRRQAAVCSLADQRRNRWIFPVVMAGVMTGSYLLLTEVLTPMLTPLASARLSPDQQHVLSMPGMDMSGQAMDTSGHAMGSAEATAERPVTFVSAAAPERLAPAAGTIHRAELAIDKMT
ncbi:MAG: hypothetical protein HY689_16640 [Chloroflexi bacterium]|nr:hypothetical protein [Chloroflexota bacterium]